MITYDEAWRMTTPCHEPWMTYHCIVTRSGFDKESGKKIMFVKFNEYATPKDRWMATNATIFEDFGELDA